jgi:hypothetical protein
MRPGKVSPVPGQAQFDPGDFNEIWMLLAALGMNLRLSWLEQ